MKYPLLASTIVIACASLSPAHAKSDKNYMRPDDRQMSAHRAFAPSAVRSPEANPWVGAHENYGPAQDDRSNSANGS